MKLLEQFERLNEGKGVTSLKQAIRNIIKDSGGMFGRPKLIKVDEKFLSDQIGHSFLSIYPLLEQGVVVFSVNGLDKIKLAIPYAIVKFPKKELAMLGSPILTGVRDKNKLHILNNLSGSEILRKAIQNCRAPSSVIYENLEINPGASVWSKLGGSKFSFTSLRAIKDTSLWQERFYEAEKYTAAVCIKWVAAYLKLASTFLSKEDYTNTLHDFLGRSTGSPYSIEDVKPGGNYLVRFDPIFVDVEMINPVNPQEGFAVKPTGIEGTRKFSDNTPIITPIKDAPTRKFTLEETYEFQEWLNPLIEGGKFFREYLVVSGKRRRGFITRRLNKEREKLTERHAINMVLDTIIEGIYVSGAPLGVMMERSDVAKLPSVVIAAMEKTAPLFGLSKFKFKDPDKPSKLFVSRGVIDGKLFEKNPEKAIKRAFTQLASKYVDFIVASLKEAYDIK